MSLDEMLDSLEIKPDGEDDSDGQNDKNHGKSNQIFPVEPFLLFEFSDHDARSFIFLA